MSNFMFRPGVREAVSLLISLIGPSGGGKTYTAMRLARGICGNKPFAVIDTEAGRAKHYADLFRFDHGDLKPPFRPSSYSEAIQIADKAGYKAIIVDSGSHEWVGEGGILDWQEEELTRMAGDDWKKREACKMASWIKPKLAHKQMVQKLLQVRANLIFCFRAEEKIAIEKDPNTGKTIIVPKGWQPICSKEMPYEMTVSLLLTPDRPGFPQPIKLQEQHKVLFPLNRQINEESGKYISEWATGGTKNQSVVEVEEDEPERVANVGETSVAPPPVVSPTETPIESPTPEGMTEAEVMADLEKRGMTVSPYQNLNVNLREQAEMVDKPKPEPNPEVKHEPAQDDKVREAKLLNSYAKEIAKMPDAKALNTWFSTNCLPLKKEFSEDGYWQLTKLVNDKLRSFKKK
jgi:hypothetical protein